MKIVLIESYLTHSHHQWASSLQSSPHWDTECISLPGRDWKWRMHGSAITLAGKINDLSYHPDLIIVSDMIDLGLLISLTRLRFSTVPFILYFHESQFNYPLSPNDQDRKKGWDNHYAFINYSSALTADRVIFNSHFHRSVFLKACREYLGQLPQPNTREALRTLAKRSEVIFPGMDFKKMSSNRISHSGSRPIILWNHRWEYDKDPTLFFNTLLRLSEKGYSFDLVVLGKSNRRSPEVFSQVRKQLEDHILQWGYAESEEEYYQWLWKSDIIVSTSRQDFFGISVVEAIFCECWPILPDRLALPEHIPSSMKQYCLYQSDQDLEEKLITLWQHLHERKKLLPQLVSHVREKYDQHVINLQYLQLFQELQTTDESERI